MNMTEDRRYNLFIEQIEALEADKDQVLVDVKSHGFSPEAVLHMVAYRRLLAHQRAEIEEFCEVGAIPDKRQQTMEFDL